MPRMFQGALALGSFCALLPWSLAEPWPGMSVRKQFWTTPFGDQPPSMMVRSQFWAKQADRTNGTTPMIKIGSPLSLHEDAIRFKQGTGYMNAYELFFDWYSQKYGGVMVNGTLHAVDLLLLDSSSSADKVTQATEYLIEEEGVDFFFADYSSGLTLPQAIVVNDHGKVLLAAGSSREAVFTDRPGVFGLLSAGNTWMRGALEAVGAADSGSRKRIWYMAESSTAIKDLCLPLPVWAPELSFDVLNDLHVVPKGSDYEAEARAVVDTLLDVKPDVFLACTYQGMCHILLKEMERRRYVPKAIIMANCVVGSSFMDEMGEAGRYVLGYAAWLPSMTLQGPLTAEWTPSSFAARFEKRFGIAPPYQTTAAFMGAAVLVHAIETANSLDPANVARTIRGMQLDSMFGRIAFAESGMQSTLMKFIQFQHEADGKDPRMVFPMGYNDLVYPIPTYEERECLNTLTTFRTSRGIVDGRCQECPMGRVSQVVAGETAGTLKRTCVTCRAGTQGVRAQDEMLCVACPMGTYSELEGSLACLPCPLGRFGNVSGLPTCRSCPPGSAAQAPGSVACAFCEPGSHQSLAEQSQCDRCVVGKFSSSLAATMCQECPKTFTTLGRGYTLPSDCGCPVGSFDRHEFDASWGPLCMACPAGVECPGFKGKLQLKPGFSAFAQDFNPVIGVWECVVKSYCPGGAPGVCASGLNSIGCSECPVGMVFSDGSCQACTAGSVVGLAFCFIGLVVVMPLLMYYLANGRVHKHTTLRQGTSISTGLMLTSLQLLGTAGALKVPWPESTRPSLDASGWLFIDSSKLGLECLGFDGALVRYIFVFLLPFCCAGGIVVLFLASRLLPTISKGRLTAWTVPMSFNVLCTMGQTFFISIANIAAIPFQCYQHPNSRHSLTVYPSILCFEDDDRHHKAIAMGVILILFVVVPYLAVSVWGSYSTYKGTQSQAQSAQQLIFYRFLLFRFRPCVWWWSNVLNVRQLLLGFSPLIGSEDQHSQVVFMVLTLVPYAVAATAYSPWRKIEFTAVDVGSCGLMVALLVSMSSLLPSSDAVGVIKGVSVALVVLIGIVTFFLPFYTFAQLFRRTLATDLSSAYASEYGMNYPNVDDMPRFAKQVLEVSQSLTVLREDGIRELMDDLDGMERLAIDRVLSILVSSGLSRINSGRNSEGRHSRGSITSDAMKAQPSWSAVFRPRTNMLRMQPKGKHRDSGTFSELLLNMVSSSKSTKETVLHEKSMTELAGIDASSVADLACAASANDAPKAGQMQHKFDLDSANASEHDMPSFPGLDLGHVNKEEI